MMITDSGNSFTDQENRYVIAAMRLAISVTISCGIQRR